VRLRVHAATVNPTDILARNGTRAEQQKADPPPYVPGMEAAGIIDEVGSGVPDRLRVGDAVMAIVVPKGSHGAYREQIALDTRSVVRAPAGATHAEACTLPMNGLTARLSLDLLKLSPGQVIAVTGAAGAYGGYVVQLAKAEGLTVIADASEEDEKLVASFGADIVVRRGDDVASRIRSHFPEGVDGLADGAVLNERVIPAVRDGGAFTSVRGFPGVPQRDIRFSTTFVRNYAQEFEKLDQLRQLVEDGRMTLRVAEVYPPERAADAHRRLEAGGTRGRLVIRF
jgi:NADPH:quinone reductase-like Zn-dependent oxidoreductase